MHRRALQVSVVAIFLAAGASTPALACSLCMNVQQAPTFRQEAAQASARLILYGTLANPQLKAGGNGATDLIIQAILRDDPFLKNKEKLELPRYLPVNDPKNPPRFLVFCDVFMDKL